VLSVLQYPVSGPALVCTAFVSKCRVVKATSRAEPRLGFSRTLARPGSNLVESEVARLGSKFVENGTAHRLIFFNGSGHRLTFFEVHGSNGSDFWRCADSPPKR
jgi:hypothetical protein